MTRDVEDFTGRYYFYDEPDFDGGASVAAQQPGSSTPIAAPTPAPTPTPAITIIPAAASIPVPVPRSAPTDLPVPAPVAAPRFSAADYAAALRLLLPRGRAWSIDPASVQSAMLLAIAATFARSDAAANVILGGSVPGQLTAMLPEWEATLGLPDPCAGETPSIDQRLDQVRGRFVGVGGQSRQRYIDFAAALGFAITITNYAPFRVGFTPVGNALCGDEWTFVWGVRVLATTGALSVDVLFCELNALKPAESSILFLGDDGDTVLAGPDGQALLAPDGTPLLSV